jgi:hypothetical protein
LTGDDCQDTKEFLVEMKKEFKTTAPSISFNSNIIAGTPTTFRGITPDAEEWNWTIKEIGKKSSGKEFTHTFDKPGKYTVETSMKGKYIGGDTTFIVTVSKKVIVIAKPPPIIEIPKPKTKVVTEIGVPPPPPPSNFGNTVLEISNQLANGNADASDRWLDEISSQLCNGCSVKINTDKARNENITITQFKNRLMNGDIDVSSVVASIDKKTKCVTQLTVVANSKK